MIFQEGPPHSRDAALDVLHHRSGYLIFCTRPNYRHRLRRDAVKATVNIRTRFDFNQNIWRFTDQTSRIANQCDGEIG